MRPLQTGLTREQLAELDKETLLTIILGMPEIVNALRQDVQELRDQLAKKR